MARTTQTKPAASGKNAASDTADMGATAPGIRVRSFCPLFHRAGRKFTSEPLDILLEALTDAQLAAIEGESMLSSQRIDIPVDSDADSATDSTLNDGAQ